MAGRNFDAKIHITAGVGTGIIIIPGGTILLPIITGIITITAGMSRVRLITIMITRAAHADITGTIPVNATGGGILQAAVRPPHHRRPQRHRVPVTPVQRAYQPALSGQADHRQDKVNKNRLFRLKQGHRPG